MSTPQQNPRLGRRSQVKQMHICKQSCTRAYCLSRCKIPCCLAVWGHTVHPPRTTAGRGSTARRGPALRQTCRARARQMALRPSACKIRMLTLGCEEVDDIHCCHSHQSNLKGETVLTRENCYQGHICGQHCSAAVLHPHPSLFASTNRTERCRTAATAQEVPSSSS